MKSRILVVDDSPTVRMTLEWVLVDASYEVRLAEDGLDALGAFNSFQPELILLDITMPNLDGWQLLEVLQRNPKLKPIPVIMISARQDEEAKLRAIAEGAKGFITKPIHDGLLISAVEKYLMPNAQAI